MIRHKKKVVAITDEQRHLLGITSLSDISKPSLFDRHFKHVLLSQTPLDYIIRSLNARVLVDCGNTSNGKVYVASYHNLDCQDRIVVVSDNPSREMQVIEAGARMMVIVGEDCGEEIIEAAKEHNCTVLLTDFDIYDVTRELDLAIPVSMIMSTEVQTFRYDDYLEDVKMKINRSRFRSYPILDTQDHVIGMLSRFHVLQHTNRNLIMVDHNEFGQSIEGAENATVLEIIDHHRIGGIKTSSPVYFRTEQTGSCATIITKIFEESNIEIPDDLAGLLCCAIISDTLNFKSVTCTKTDIEKARKLAEIAGLDIKTLGPKILSAGANLANKSVESILNHDLKRFDIAKSKVVVGQINIVNFEDIIGLRDKMNNHLEQYASASGSDICMMVFSLIDGTGSYVLSRGPEAKLVNAAFEDKSVNVDGYMFLPKVMSRKLQIIPTLTTAAEER